MDYLVHHLLLSSAQRFPEKEALVMGTQRLNYREVTESSTALALGLRDAGLVDGDRVGIYLEPSIAQVVSIFGISQADAVFVPINDMLFPRQVAHIASDCAIKALITDAKEFMKLTEAICMIPSLEFVVLMDDGELDDKTVSTIDICILRYSKMTTQTTANLASLLQIFDNRIGNDLAAILYTSGSTGKPKGIMLSHANIIAGASIVSDYLSISEKERILAVLPFSFDAGLNQLTTAFQQGGTIVLMTFVFARQIVKKLIEEKITALAGVPTLWSLLVQPNSTLNKHELPHLRYITNTGGAMPQNVLAELRRLLPPTEIFLMYGLTEAFRSTYLTPKELDRRPTSIGKAIPNTEIILLNDDGELCKPGEVGELVHRGPTVSLGYWGHPALNEQIFRPHPFRQPEQPPFEKVCYSGDLVKMDEDGFLYFVGRRDTMIKTSGFRVSPTEVEEILFQSGSLQAAAVIGINDDFLGQHIKAFVVAKNGTELDIDALLSFCSENMPRYMVPKTIEVMDALPKTGTGKVNYPALRQREETVV